MVLRGAAEAEWCGGGLGCGVAAGVAVGGGLQGAAVARRGLPDDGIIYHFEFLD